ncbi:MAG: SprB repeat-containing protein [Chitinophagales bacterium]
MQSFSISNANAPILSIDTTGATYYGTNTGSATATVTGGASPYNYSWGATNTNSNMCMQVIIHLLLQIMRDVWYSKIIL